MALDENIYKLRLEKLKQIEALGQRVYPTKYDFTQTIQQVLAEQSQKSAEQLEASRVNVRIAGRIMAIRLMGKAGFAHLQQDGQRLQIYVKKDAVGEKGFFQLRHSVYGREGEPCLNCRTPIKRIVIAGRSSHYCPQCQK